MKTDNTLLYSNPRTVDPKTVSFDVKLSGDYNLKNIHGDVAPLGGVPQTYKLTKKEADYIRNTNITPSMNIEEMLAQSQTKAQRWLYAPLRFVTTTLAKIGQMVGHIGGLPPALISGDIDWITNNAMASFFADAEEWLKDDLLPIHKTQYYNNSNVWAQMGTASFWTDDVVDGFAFLTSMFIPGKGLAMATRALATSAMRLSAAKAIGHSMRMAKLDKAVYGINPNIQKLISRNMDRLTIVGTSAIGEAGFEARETQNHIRDMYYTVDERGRSVPKIDPNTGERYSIEEIEELAATAARQVFRGNVVWLMMTNFVQYEALMGSFKAFGVGKKSGLRPLYNRVKPVKPATKLGKVRAVAQGIGLNIISEGLLEEGFQEALQDSIEQEDFTNAGFWGQARSVYRSWIDGFNDDENIKAMVMGGIVAFVPGGISGYSRYTSRKKQSEIQSKILRDTILKYRGNTKEFYKYNIAEDGTKTIARDSKGNPIMDEVKIMEQATNMAAKVGLLNVAMREGVQDVETLNRLVANKAREYIYELISQGIIGEALMSEIDFFMKGEADFVSDTYGEQSGESFRKDIAEQIKKEAKVMTQRFNYISNLADLVLNAESLPKAIRGHAFRSFVEDRFIKSYLDNHYNYDLVQEGLAEIRKQFSDLKLNTKNHVNYLVQKLGKTNAQIAKLKKELASEELGVSTYTTHKEELAALQKSRKDIVEQIKEGKRQYNIENDTNLPEDWSYIDKESYDKIADKYEEFTDLESYLEGEEARYAERLSDYDNLSEFLEKDYKKYLKDIDALTELARENIEKAKNNLKDLIEKADRDADGNVVITKDMKDLANALESKDSKNKGILERLVKAENKKNKKTETKKETKEAKKEETRKEDTRKDEGKKETDIVTPKGRTHTAFKDSNKFATESVVKHIQYLNKLFSILGLDIVISKDNLRNSAVRKLLGLDNDTQTIEFYTTQFTNILKNKDVSVELENSIGTIIVNMIAGYVANNNAYTFSEILTLGRIVDGYRNANIEIHGKDFKSKLLDGFNEFLQALNIQRDGSNIVDVISEIDQVLLLNDVFSEFKNLNTILEFKDGETYSEIAHKELETIKDEASEITQEQKKTEEETEIDEKVEPSSVSTSDGTISISPTNLLESFPRLIRDPESVNNGDYLLDLNNKAHRNILDILQTLSKIKKGDSLYLELDKDNYIYQKLYKEDNVNNVPIKIVFRNDSGESVTLGHIQSAIYLQYAIALYDSYLSLANNNRKSILTPFINIINENYDKFDKAKDQASKNHYRNAIINGLVNEYNALREKANKEGIDPTFKDFIDSLSKSVEYKATMENIGNPLKTSGANALGLALFQEFQHLKSQEDNILAFSVRLKGELNIVRKLRDAVVKGETVVVKAESINSGTITSESVFPRNFSKFNLGANDLLINRKKSDGTFEFVDVDGKPVDRNKYGNISPIGEGFFVHLEPHNSDLHSSTWLHSRAVHNAKVSEIDMTNILSDMKSILEGVRDGTLNIKDRTLVKRLGIPVAEVNLQEQREESKRVTNIHIKGGDSIYVFELRPNGKLNVKIKKGNEFVSVLDNVDSIDRTTMIKIYGDLVKTRSGLSYMVNFNSSRAELEAAIKEGKLQLRLNRVVDSDGNLVSIHIPHKTEGKHMSLNLKVKTNFDLFSLESKPETTKVETKEETKDVKPEIKEVKDQPKLDATDKTKPKSSKRKIEPIVKLNIHTKKKDKPSDGKTALVGEVAEYDLLQSNNKQLLNDLSKLENLTIDTEIKAIHKWWNDRFPTIPLHRNVIELRTKHGQAAYGLFHNSMVEIAENAPYGIEFHEAFHVAFNLYLDPDRKSQIYKEAIRLYGTRDYNKLEELLSEDFRRYVIYRNNDSVTEKILTFFKELFNYMFEIVNSKKYSTINTFFNDIYSNNSLNKVDTHHYNNLSQVRSLLENYGLTKDGKYESVPISRKTKVGDSSVAIHDLVALINSQYRGRYEVRLREVEVSKYVKKDGKKVIQNKTELKAELFDLLANDTNYETSTLLIPGFKSYSQQIASTKLLVGLYSNIANAEVLEDGTRYSQLKRKDILENPDLDIRSQMIAQIQAILEEGDVNNAQIELLELIIDDLTENYTPRSIYADFKLQVSNLFGINVLDHREITEKLSSKLKQHDLQETKLYENLQEQESLLFDGEIDPLIRRWIDEDLISESSDKNLRRSTKLAIASLVARDRSGDIKINDHTGVNEYVDFNMVYPKIMYSLMSSINLQHLMSKLDKNSHALPYLVELKEKIETDTNLQHSFLVDFNRIMMPESYLDLRANIVKSEYRKLNKSAHYVVSNNWANMFKYLDRNGVFATKEFSDKRNKIEGNLNAEYNKVINNISDPRGLAKVLSEKMRLYGIDVPQEALLHYFTKPTSENLSTPIMDMMQMVQDFETYIVSRKEAKNLYAKLNMIADELLMYLDYPIEFSYMSTEMKQKYPVTEKSLASEFIQLFLHRGSHESIDQKLQERLDTYLQDPSMKYSNFFRNILSFDTNTNEYVKNDLGNYVILHTPLLDNFGGFIDKHNKGTLPKNSGDITLGLMQIITYLDGMKYQKNNPGFFPNTANFFFPTLADTGKTYTINLPRYNLEGVKNDTLERFELKKGSRLLSAFQNIVMSELVDMNFYAENLFKVENGHLVVNEEFANSDGVYLDRHYKIDGVTEDGHANKVFLDSNGKPVGATFKFHTLRELNNNPNIIDEVTGLPTITPEDVINNPEISKIVEDAISRKIFEIVDKHIKLLEPISDQLKGIRLNDVYEHRTIIRRPESKQELDAIKDKLVNFLGENVEGKYVDYGKNTKLITYPTPQAYHLISDFAVNQYLANIQISEVFLGKLSEFKSEAEYNQRAKMMLQKGRGRIDRGRAHRTVRIYNHPVKTTFYDLMVNYLKDNVKGADATTRIKQALRPFEKGTDKADGFSFTTTTAFYEQLMLDGIADSVSHMFDRKTVGDKASKRYVYSFKDNVDINDVVFLMTSIKSLYTDRTIDSNGKLTTTLVKHSAFPLDKMMTKNSPQWETIRQYLEDNNIDEAQFNSTIKRSNNVTQAVSKDGYTLDVDMLKALPVHELRSESKMIQVDVAEHHLDSENKLALQLRKHLINVKDNHNFKDFITGKELKGEALKQRIHELFEELIDLDADTLNKELRINPKSIIDKTSDAIKGVQKALYREGVSRSWSKDILDVLEPNHDYSDFQGSLDLLGINKPITQLLASLYNNNVLRTRLPGGHVVNVSDVFFTDGRLESLSESELKAKAKKEGVEYTPRNLKSYIDNNGRFVVEAITNVWSKDFINPDGTIIDIEQLSGELRHMVGYRIPTSGKSMSFILKVVGFVPKEYSSMIILPDNLITQTGWDFDIDSVFLSRYNHKEIAGLSGFKTELGKALSDRYFEVLEYSKMESDNSATTKSKLQNELVSLWMSVLSSPDTALQRLTPSDTVNNNAVRDDINILLGESLTLDPYNPTDQLRIFNNIRSGSKVLSAAANTVSVATILQEVGVKLSEPIVIKVGKDYKILERLLQDDTGNTIDMDGQEVIDALGEDVSNAVDSVKNLMIRNLNDKTLGVYSLLKMLMAGTKYAGYFIAQEAIEIHTQIKEVQAARATLTGFSDNANTLAKNRILTKLYISAKNANPDSVIIPALDSRIAEGKDLYLKEGDKLSKALLDFIGLDHNEGVINPTSYNALELRNIIATRGSILQGLINDPKIELDYWRAQYHILEKYINLKDIHSEILPDILLLNADKKGLGGTFTEIREYMSKITAARSKEESKIVTIDGNMNIVSAVYSEHFYPTLRKYYKRVNIDGYNNLSPLFESEGLLLTDKHSGLLSIFNDRYSHLYDAARIKYVERYAEYIKARSLDGFYLFNKDNLSEAVQHTILGIAKTTDSLSTAEKLVKYKEEYRPEKGDMPHWSDYILPLLGENIIDQHGGIHKIEAVNIEGNPTLLTHLQETMLSDFYNGTVQEAKIIEELVQYEFLTSGLTFTRRGLRRLIPNRLLVDMGLVDYYKSLRSEFNNTESTIAGESTFENFIRNNVHDQTLVPFTRLPNEVVDSIRIGETLHVPNQVIDSKSSIVRNSPAIKIEITDVNGNKDSVILIRDKYQEVENFTTYVPYDSLGSRIYLEPSRNKGIKLKSNSTFVKDGYKIKGKDVEVQEDSDITQIQDESTQPVMQQGEQLTLDFGEEIDTKQTEVVKDDIQEGNVAIQTEELATQDSQFTSQGLNVRYKDSNVNLTTVFDMTKYDHIVEFKTFSMNTIRKLAPQFVNEVETAIRDKKIVIKIPIDVVSKLTNTRSNFHNLYIIGDGSFVGYFSNIRIKELSKTENVATKISGEIITNNMMTDLLGVALTNSHVHIENSNLANSYMDFYKDVSSGTNTASINILVKDNISKSNINTVLEVIDFYTEIFNQNEAVIKLQYPTATLEEFMKMKQEERDSIIKCL